MTGFADETLSIGGEEEEKEEEEEKRKRRDTRVKSHEVEMMSL